jgi:UV DNA damage repair endonuclease
MRQYEKLSHAERRTKLKELEHLNLETIEGLDTELRDELKLKRNKYNAQLGIEEKEAGDG